VADGRSKLKATLKQFLKEEEKDSQKQREKARLLWKYYARNKEYAKAARGLMQLAKEPPSGQDRPSLKKRKHWFARVTGYARGAGSQVLLREASLGFRLARIQYRYTKRHNAPADDGLLSHQELVELCCKEQDWDLVLELFSFCGLDDDQQLRMGSVAWQNFLLTLTHRDTLDAAARRVVDLVQRIGTDSEVVDTNILLPILENFRINRNGTVEWAKDTLLAAGIQPNLILQWYVKAVGSELDQNLKWDFFFCAMRLGRIRGSVLELFKRDAVHRPYYEEALRIMKNWPSV
jgi:hypothetical protein